MDILLFVIPWFEKPDLRRKPEKKKLKSGEKLLQKYRISFANNGGVGCANWTLDRKNVPSWTLQQEEESMVPYAISLRAMSRAIKQTI